MRPAVSKNGLNLIEGAIDNGFVTEMDLLVKIDIRKRLYKHCNLLLRRLFLIPSRC